MMILAFTVFGLILAGIALAGFYEKLKFERMSRTPSQDRLHPHPGIQPHLHA
jgi:hypothetical protein